MQKTNPQTSSKELKKELFAFAPRAAAIEQLQRVLSEIPKPKELQERSIRKYDTSNRKQYIDIPLSDCQ